MIGLALTVSGWKRLPTVSNQSHNLPRSKNQWAASSGFQPLETICKKIGGGGSLGRVIGWKRFPAVSN